MKKDKFREDHTYDRHILKLLKKDVYQSTLLDLIKSDYTSYTENILITERPKAKLDSFKKIIQKFDEIQPIFPHDFDRDVIRQLLIPPRRPAVAWFQGDVYRLPEQVVAGLDEVAAATGGQINTHTASIHTSVSESALKLRATFGDKPFAANIRHQFDDLIHDDQFLTELSKSVNSKLNPEEPRPSKRQIQDAIYRALNKIVFESADWKDPASNIGLQELLHLLLTGIAQIEDRDTKSSAYLQLATAMYLLQIEYGFTSSCLPGFFNGLVYSQVSTLPDQIHIVIHTRSNATNSLKYMLKKYAQQFYLQQALDMESATPFATAEDFEAKLCADQERIARDGLDIICKLVQEFHLLFGYKTAAEAAAAATDTDTMNRHSMTLVGCNSQEIFALIPYAEILQELSMSPQPSRSAPRP